MSLNPLAIFLFACAAALSGCATGTDDKEIDDRASGKASELTVVDANPAGETRLRRGQLLAIELASNASTGYAWEVEDNGSPVLESAPVPASAAALPASPLAGAGGTSRWHYRAAQPGTATLRLVYRRSWEKGIEPVRIATYRVVVE